MSNTTPQPMKTKNTYSVSVLYKDGSPTTIVVEAWGIGWVSHEVEKALKVNTPFDAEIIRIEKLQ